MKPTALGLVYRRCGHRRQDLSYCIPTVGIVGKVLAVQV